MVVIIISILDMKKLRRAMVNGEVGEVQVITAVILGLDWRWLEGTRVL